MANQNISYLLRPNPDGVGLTRKVIGTDHKGEQQELLVLEERPLTIFLNSQEIVTAMSIGDYPELLAIGFLRNQGMLDDAETISAVDYAADLDTVVVRTDHPTNHEEKLKKKTRTSGCAIGTVFGDMMAALDGVTLPHKTVRVDWLYRLSHVINQTPSLYLAAGAIHGCVLCQEDQPLVYMEDVGRHNAVDKIAGWMRMNAVQGGDKILYTTGRLTSEMVIKCALMGIPVLVSRSGFTAWGVELAQQVGLTLIGRLRGERFICLSGGDHLIYPTS